MQAVDFKKALGCEEVGVLDMGAGSGLLSMMAARYNIIMLLSLLLLDTCRPGLHNAAEAICFGICQLHRSRTGLQLVAKSLLLLM